MDNQQNKPGVQKVTNVQKRADGSIEVTGADGNTFVLPNTFSPQVGPGVSDGYIITESNGNRLWQSTSEFEAQQKQTALQNQQQTQQQAQRDADAAKLQQANEMNDREQDVIKSDAPSKRSR
jgi:hypothetical protein